MAHQLSGFNVGTAFSEMQGIQHKTKIARKIMVSFGCAG